MALRSELYFREGPFSEVGFRHEFREHGETASAASRYSFREPAAARRAAASRSRAGVTAGRVGSRARRLHRGVGPGVAVGRDPPHLRLEGRTYLAWLDTADVDGDPLTDPAARDWAVRDYRTHLAAVL